MGGFVFWLLSHFFHPSEQELFNCHCSSVIVGFVLVASVVLKLWNRRRDLANETKLLYRCRRDYIIGFGGIGFISIVSHIGFAVVNFDYDMMMLIMCTCSMCNLIEFCFFVLPSLRYSYMYSSYLFSFVNWSLHLILFLISISSNPHGADIITLSVQSPDDVIIYTTSLLQLYIVIFSGQSVKCFFDAVTNQVYLTKTYAEDEEDLEDSKHEARYNELECKICFSRFNLELKRRTPRILTSCGHTVCQRCLLRFQGNQTYVICPVCRRLTNGSPDKLPINYAIIGLIEEIEEEGITNVE